VADISLSAQEQKVRLCADCAAEWEAERANWASGAGNLAAAMLNRDKKEKLLCSRCGFDMEQVVRLGRVGCPICYGEFEALIGDLLQQTIPRPRHTGKQPGNWRNGRGTPDTPSPTR
jgi:protein-arginine kinase activator protein McsA